MPEHLVREWRRLAQDEVVGNVDTQGEDARREDAQDAGLRKLVDPKLAPVVEKGRHDEHSNCNERRGVVQQLHGIAVERFLIRVGEDLRHGCGNNGTDGKNAAHHV